MERERLSGGVTRRRWSERLSRRLGGGPAKGSQAELPATKGADTNAGSRHRFTTPGAGWVSGISRVWPQ